MNSRHLSGVLGSASVFALDRSRVGWGRSFTFASHPPCRKAEKLPTQVLLRDRKRVLQGSPGNNCSQLVGVIRAQDWEGKKKWASG